MAEDRELADAVRSAAVALRNAVVTARAGGLKVSVPLMLAHWVDAGTPPGEPEAWTITRSSL